MKIKDLYYSKIKSIIMDFINPDVFSRYVEGKSDDDISELISFNESFSNVNIQIDKFQTSNDPYIEFETLRNLITSFLTKFGDYNALNINSVLICLLLLEKISLYFSDILLDSDIDFDNYILDNIDDDDININFLYPNSDFYEQILIINMAKRDAVDEYIEKEITVNYIIFIALLEKIDIKKNYSKKILYLLNKKYSSRMNGSILSLLKIKIISCGKIIHNPHKYISLPSIHSDCPIDYNNYYNQFNDIIYTLSEYNSCENLLEKYLKIYQVIENFMYRYPIVDLMKSSGPSNEMISIRDFRRLYRNTEENEITSLKTFINEVLKLPFNTTQTFKKFVFDKWNSLVTSKHDDIKSFLKKISIKRNLLIQETDIDYLFSDIIYQFRNSIVHNKETEFHLTYANMPAIVPYLCENFLIICLEEIIFNIILKHNDIVWYPFPELKLYF